MKKRNFFFPTILIAFVLLILGEAVARFLLGLGDPPLSVVHPTIEYMFQPDQSVSRFGNDIYINRFGMRSEEFSPKKPSNEKRVLVFGDSVINGGNLTDQNDLATSIVSDTLNQMSSQQIVIGNVSAGSWGPGNWLAYAQEYGFFDADIVTLVISSHDCVDNPTFQELDPNTHPTLKPLSALSEGITRYLPRFLPWKREEMQLDGKKELSEEDMTEGLNALRSFLMLAKSSATEVVVFQHFEKEEILTSSSKPGYQRVQDLCTKIEVSPRSLEPYFSKVIQSGANPYRDNIHPNKIGQQALADAILDYLQKTD